MVGETQGGMRFDSNKEFILQRRLSSVYQNDSLLCNKSLIHLKETANYFVIRKEVK